jgi:hypothetical protein
MILRTVLLTVILLFSFQSKGAESYLSGEIVNITSVQEGLLIMLNTGVPTHCDGTPANWLLIKQEHSVMVSVTLAMWMADKKHVTVYTSGRPGGGFCVVNQVDPA